MTSRRAQRSALLIVLSALILAGMACTGVNISFGDEPTAVAGLPTAQQQQSGPATLPPAQQNPQVTQTPPQQASTATHPPAQPQQPNPPATQPPAQPPAQPSTVQFTVINQSATDEICYVYISPTSSSEWGNDWLGTATIHANSSYAFTVPSGSYDLRADFCGGGDPVIEMGRVLNSNSSWAPTPPSQPNPPPQPSGALDYDLAANYGSRSLTAGFMPDPYTVAVTSGGIVDASYLGGSCRGYATSAPDFELTYTPGAQSLLRIYFTSSGDATLIINGPSGGWYCSDDSYGSNNPSLDFTDPSAGVYDIWVGSYTSGQNLGGTLYITERLDSHP